MMFFENLKMALISLKNAKLRSFLTMLGIIIGVASVTAVIAVGQGVKDSVTGQINDLGTNLIQVNPGQAVDDSGDGEQQGGFNFASALGVSTVTEQDLATIRSLPDVEAAAPFMIVGGAVKNGDKAASNAILYGTIPDLAKTINIKYEFGGFIDKTGAKQAFLGYNVAKSLFDDPAEAVGKSISVRGSDYTVIGVMQKPKEGSLMSGGAGFGNAVIIDLEAAKSYNNGAAQIMEIDVKVKSSDRVNSVKAEIKKRLKTNHDGQNDFTVLTQEEQLGMFDTIMNLLTSFIAAIASISLVVGGVGIMNIMLVSVTERTREIGIRKALGATRNMILMQFLIEATVISVIGGALGVAAAYGLGMIIDAVAKIQPVFTWQTFALSVGVSAAVGLVFGMAPAIKAARKRPIQALKYE